jgi:hypothetical protein
MSYKIGDTEHFLERDSTYLDEQHNKLIEILDTTNYVIVYIREYYMDGVGQEYDFYHPAKLNNIDLEPETILAEIKDRFKLIATIYLNGESETLEIYIKP